MLFSFRGFDIAQCAAKLPDETGEDQRETARVDVVDSTTRWNVKERIMKPVQPNFSNSAQESSEDTDDTMTATSKETYPAWLWQVVDEFDRWAADRLPLVQDMIRDAVREQTLPSRTEQEAEIRPSPCRTKKGETARQKEPTGLRSEHLSYGKEAATLTPEQPGLAGKVAYLACVHDVMIEQDDGRKSRKGWKPVALDFNDIFKEIDFATLFGVKSIPCHSEDRHATGSCQIEDYWRDVREAIPHQPAKAGGTSHADTESSSASHGATGSLRVPNDIPAYINAEKDSRTQELLWMVVIGVAKNKPKIAFAYRQQLANFLGMTMKDFKVLELKLGRRALYRESRSGKAYAEFCRRDDAAIKIADLTKQLKILQ